jgi:hypothetical protein
MAIEPIPIERSPVLSSPNRGLKIQPQTTPITTGETTMGRK